LLSLALNGLLFSQGRQYYLQLNEVRLDPIGLDAYADAAQQSLARPVQRVVVFFGDSRARSWPAPDLDPYTFVNRGIGNQTSAQVAQRFEHYVEPLHPQVIVVQVGINDLKAIPLFPERKEAIVANCQQKIGEIVADSTRVGAITVLTTIFPVGKVPVERRLFWSDDVALAVDEVNAYIRSLEGEDVIVLDAFAVLADDRGVARSEFSSDLLHLRSAGYQALHDPLASILEALD
jgi:lysophospholipase L1-like esterase